MTLMPFSCIIETMGGDRYCGDCYGDLRSPSEQDFDMFVKRRLNDGACGCCEAEVVAGTLVDNQGDSAVGFPDERNPDR